MISPLQGQAACRDRLDLVDAAYDRPGSREGRELRARFCPHCPIAARCFDEGMHGELGVWGGTSPKQRTESGARSLFNRHRARSQEVA